VVQLAEEVRLLSRSKINMRMVAEEQAHTLTGFGHNAVTPICSRTRIPIIMSHRIAELQEPFFLGAGETDLKVGLLSRDFVEAFKEWPVYVVDCTMD
jgi:prolyl-tRNA editing enzyme YbaK/EbsC (Cys-tRNA(Pro) deacylase)